MRHHCLLPPALLAIMIGFLCPQAKSACLISTVSSVSPLVANLGSYTTPATPAVQAITINVQGQYLITLGGVGGGCSMGLFFSRPGLPASMAIDGGGSATLSYSLETAPSGGNSLLHVGGGYPPNANMVILTFSPPSILGLGDYSLNFTIYGQMLPGVPQQGGSYTDTLTLTLVGDLLILLPVTVATRQFSVLGDVTKTCTIGGVTNPAADNATIPVIAGNVDTAPIARSYANVACNSPSQVQLTSLGGALSGPPAPGGAFAHAIDYSAEALFAGAAAQIDTAANPSASGTENGLPSAASGTMPQGTLSLSITPHANVLPLARGSYADTLRITITPN